MPVVSQVHSLVCASLLKGIAAKVVRLLPNDGPLVYSVRQYLLKHSLPAPSSLLLHLSLEFLDLDLATAHFVNLCRHQF
jgi:hypothetical protein